MRPEEQKVIKIFVASSIEEFEAERAKLAMFVLGLNNDFREKGFYFELELCENVENSLYPTERKQDQYNEFIQNADFVFVLFFKKVGEYTVEEFDLARKMFRENGKPRVYVYFRETDKTKAEKAILAQMEKVEKEMQHYWGAFDTIETVEYDLMRALAKEYLGKDAVYEHDDTFIWTVFPC